MRVNKSRGEVFYPEVEVDDAGWGDLVGGVIIGGYNPLKDEFRWTKIHVKHFQGEAFEKKDYLLEARRSVNKILGDLRADKRFYKIALCTGYIFSQAAQYLRDNGWRVVRRKIEGTCQEMVETRFRKELIKIGVPPGMVTNMPSGANRFMQLFNWVKESPTMREKYVKSGWKSWQTKWRSRLYD